MAAWPGKRLQHFLADAVPAAAAASMAGAPTASATLPPSIGPSPSLGPGEPPRSTLHREWLLLALALGLLMAVVVPPLVNLGRYQHRIVSSMSRSLGREVTLGAVTLRLLPMPALVMTDVVVNEDPAFGAEPALRAPRVVAQLRLTSLWRGHLEVSRVEMSDASLNLVRDSTGRWNVGSVLLQASHVSNAPTAQRRAGAAPRFPYIQITDSRINVKQGVEKLPYSLLNANLSMWLADPDVWQLRLDGQPVRTDVNLGLSDTGLLRVAGRLHRATMLGQMPVALHVDWSSAPLGQVSRLLLGGDRGWRGDLHASSDVSGDLDDLAIETHLLIANLHREEFSPSEPFAVDATCRAAYSRAAHSLSHVNCRWPVGDGQLLLAGSLSLDQTSRDTATRKSVNSVPISNLTLQVDQLPASFLVAAAGLARSDFAPVFRLEGALSGTFLYNVRSGEPALYTGVVEAARLRLLAPGLEQPLEIAEARFTASTPAPSGEPILGLTIAPLDLGGPTPAEIDAQLTAQGFLLHAAGGASLTRVEALGRAAHLLPAAFAWLAPQGLTEFDVTRVGSWQADASSSVLPGATSGASSEEASSSVLEEASSPSTTMPAVTRGWLRLHNAVYAPHFLAEGVTVPSAQATFLPGEIDWSVPSALFHQVPLQLTASYPLDCAGQPQCVTRVQMSSASLDCEKLLLGLKGTGGGEHLLDQLWTRTDNPLRQWPAIDGTLHVDSFTIGRVTLRNVEGAVSISQGVATLGSLDAQALGGTLHGEGVLHIEDGSPHYQVSTVLTRVNAAALGNIFHENWGAGTLNVSSQLKLNGVGANQLAASSTGDFHAEWLRGGLGTETPLARFARWSAEGRIEHQALAVIHGELVTDTSSQPVPVTGRIAFDRSLGLQLGRPSVQGQAGELGSSAASVAINGTLSQPSE